MVDVLRTTDGRRLDGYTISSPSEHDGSGELIIKLNGNKLFKSIQWQTTGYFFRVEKDKMQVPYNEKDGRYKGRLTISKM